VKEVAMQRNVSTSESTSAGGPEAPTRAQRLEAYWRENQRLVLVLLVIWFIAGYGHPIWAKQLNEIQILTGFPLGYYLASQLSLVVFVILIFAYALIMNNRVDRKYGFDQETAEAQRKEEV
jgi:putative solute:sodium symporter small subunit